eukprot:GHVQ01007036.1.p1 GENE.GHVQ01007036.1~~GHVQ01007036.1.p1  ORF type:complete len:279 (-),score=34.00 GHVQ01007036.1:895-1731(-)
MEHKRTCLPSQRQRFVTCTTTQAHSHTHTHIDQGTTCKSLSSVAHILIHTYKYTSPFHQHTVANKHITHNDGNQQATERIQKRRQSAYTHSALYTSPPRPHTPTPLPHPPQHSATLEAFRKSTTHIHPRCTRTRTLHCTCTHTHLSQTPPHTSTKWMPRQRPPRLLARFPRNISVCLLPPREWQIPVLNHPLYLLLHCKKEQQQKINQQDRPKDRQVKCIEESHNQCDKNSPATTQPELILRQTTLERSILFSVSDRQLHALFSLFPVIPHITTKSDL